MSSSVTLPYLIIHEKMGNEVISVCFPCEPKEQSKLIVPARVSEPERSLVFSLVGGTSEYPGAWFRVGYSDSKTHCIVNMDTFMLQLEGVLKAHQEAVING